MSKCNNEPLLRDKFCHFQEHFLLTYDVCTQRQDNSLAVLVLLSSSFLSAFLIQTTCGLNLILDHQKNWNYCLVIISSTCDAKKVKKAHPVSQWTLGVNSMKTFIDIRMPWTALKLNIIEKLFRKCLSKPDLTSTNYVSLLWLRFYVYSNIESNIDSTLNCPTT